MKIKQCLFEYIIIVSTLFFGGKTAQITVLNKYLRKVLTRLTIYLHMDV